MRATDLGAITSDIARRDTIRQLAAAKLRPLRKFVAVLAKLPTAEDRQPFIDYAAKHWAATFPDDESSHGAN